jgi:hypothetical protein
MGEGMRNTGGGSKKSAGGSEMARRTIGKKMKSIEDVCE